MDRFYPGVGATFRAWVGEADGTAWGIVGVAFTRPHASLFSAFEEEYRPMLGRFAIWRLVKRVELVFKELKVPVRACAEPGEVTSPALLTRMGMAKIDSRDGVDLYEWRGD